MIISARSASMALRILKSCKEWLIYKNIRKGEYDYEICMRSMRMGI